MSKSGNNIYLILQGRIGNQLFQYAFARKIQIEKGLDSKIIIDDSRILELGWQNSLVFYNLPNVEFTHSNIITAKKLGWNILLLRTIYKILVYSKNYNKKYVFEKRYNKIFGKYGMFICENGYIEPKVNLYKPTYLEGYFQSEKYFESCKHDILKLFSSLENEQSKIENYCGIDLIRKRNSVCISIKVEHNIGNPLYDVCTISYWKQAVKYIIDNVENPLFFICSDNVKYVIENIIDASKFEYIVQDSNLPVHISLAVMSECKHFIIGNTSFGWWAQYLSGNINKIIVAPSRWMGVDMPIDIYQESWKLIEV